MPDSSVLEAPATPVTSSAPVVPATAPVAPASDSIIPKPWMSEWVQADATLNPKALERLPEHLKGLRPTLERQKSFEDVLTVLQHSQVLNGKKALAPLPADAPAQVIAERKALLDTINGVPASPKDYGIAKPADFPDAHWNQPLAEGFAKWAQEHSVSPAAAQKLVAVQMEAVKGQLAQQAQYEQNFWANEQKTFDGIIRSQNIPADRAASLVEKGAIALGLDLTNERTKTFLKGSDARLMAMRHALATGEDSFVQGDSRNVELNPHDLAEDAIHNKANPLYDQYWNRESKFPRAVQEAAIAKVNEWRRLAAAKNPPPDRRRR